MTLAFLLAFTVWVLSYFRSVFYQFPDPSAFPSNKIVQFPSGQWPCRSHTLRGGEAILNCPGLSSSPVTSSLWGISSWHSPRAGRFLPAWTPYVLANDRCVIVALWTPVALFAMPMVIFWVYEIRRTRMSDRRRNPLGCHACGYNLTGNLSGICPECGNPIKHPQP
jgi:hypothetical protein